MTEPGAGTLGPQVYCFACGAQIDARAEICPRCGVRQAGRGGGGSAARADRIAATLLAFFLGMFGIHKFYLGKVGQGVVSLVFFWTFIPAFIAWLEGIRWLAMSDADWAARYGGRTEPANPLTFGCLWLVALGPVLWIGFLLLLAVSGTPLEPGSFAGRG